MWDVALRKGVAFSLERRDLRETEPIAVEKPG